MEQCCLLRLNVNQKAGKNQYYFGILCLHFNSLTLTFSPSQFCSLHLKRLKGI